MTDQDVQEDTSREDRKLTRIEQAIDRDVAAETQMMISGLRFTTMLEVMEFSKVMATADKAIRPFLRRNVGSCLAITMQAKTWGFDPFAVAQHAYVVNDNIAYESQLVRALIETRCPLHEDNLNHRFDGEGPDMTCTVWAKCKVKGVVKTLEWTSPPFVKIQPKNSPLWTTKPKLQLLYNTQRDWCRVWFPHILLGVNSVDDMIDSPIGPEHAKDVTPESPGLAARLRGPGEGFSQEAVERGLNGDEEVVAGMDGTVVDDQSGTAAVTGDSSAPVSDAQSAKTRRKRKAAAEPAGAAAAEPASDGQPKAENAPAASSVAAEGTQTEKPREPNSPEAYRTWLGLWLMAYEDPAAVRRRWTLERTMRGRLGMTVDDANALYGELVKPRIDVLVDQYGDPPKD